MKTVPCKGCGKPIVWAKLPDGTKVPLDPAPPTYQFCDAPGTDPDGANAFRVNGKDYTRNPVFVSHFATCPKAAQFSRSRPSS